MNIIGKKSVTLLLILSLLISCSSRKMQEKEAEKRLAQIQLLIDQSAYNKAKIDIDSIHKLFPLLVDKRRVAVALLDTIIRRESSRSLAYCDSILPFKIHLLDSIQKNFRFEKDSKYQDIGNYVYKTEQTESNASRIYLKTYVDENAVFYLVSNYCGSKIDQQSIEVSVNDLFAHTDSIELSDPNNHRFDDAGSHFESLVFKNKSQREVVDFITQSNSKSLKVTLRGKKSYSYYLAEADRKAILATYHFWKVKKDVVQLQNEIKKSISRIERINRNKK
jgi:hypothetical protein